MMWEIFKQKMYEYSHKRTFAALHTRPILLNLFDFGLIPLPDLELATIGKGKATLSLTLDKPRHPIADTCYDAEGTHIPIFSKWIRKNPSGVFISPRLFDSTICFHPAWKEFQREVHATSQSPDFKTLTLPSHIYEQVEPNLNFARIMNKSDVAIPHYIEDYAPLLPPQHELEKIFGERYVVQTNDSSGGSGTAICGVYHDWDDAKSMVEKCHPGTWFRVCTYIDGYEANGQAVVLPDGKVLLDPLSHKPSCGKIRHITGGKPQGAVGDDWTNPWPRWAQTKYAETMIRVGKYIHQTYGYVGIFGIDFIINLECERLTPHEINAHYQGTSFHHDRRALLNERPSTFALWLLAALGVDDFSWIDEVTYNMQALQESGGWQFDIHPDSQTPLPVPIAQDMNGWWKWTANQELQRSDEASGEILIFSPLPGQLLTPLTRNNDRRILAPSQLYCWPKQSGKPLHFIFCPEVEQVSNFGNKVIRAARVILYE